MEPTPGAIIAGAMESSIVDRLKKWRGVLHAHMPTRNISIQIRLEHAQQALFQIGTSELDRVIIIGRSQKCSWRVPQTDTAVSSQHARIYSDDEGKAWIEDLDSSNGVYTKGKQIKKKRLKAGDQFSIGESIILVEPLTAADCSKRAPEIVVRSGEDSGKRIPVTERKLMIGSLPESSLLFLDPLVSRRHAVIYAKEDGTCWIKDLGSRNGTSVNRIPLLPDQEQQLRHRNRISVVHDELSFRAPSEPHVKPWMLVSGAILVIALGAGIISCQTYKLLHLSPEGQIKKARAYAAEEDFNRAIIVLGAFEEPEVDALRALIARWHATRQEWTRIQNLLNRGEWDAAAEALRVLELESEETWTWNEDAPQEKEKAGQTLSILDELVRAQSYALREDVGYEEIARVRAVLSEVLTAEEDGQSYFPGLHKALSDANAKLEDIQASGEALELILEKLDLWPPPLEWVIRELEQFNEDVTSETQDRVQLYLDPIKTLGQALEQLRQFTYRLIWKEEGAMAEPLELSLPKPEACALHDGITIMRSRLESHGSLLHEFAELLQAIATRGQSDADSPSVPQPWLDHDSVAKVLAGDGLQGSAPQASRKAPTCAYDQYLGIEDFFKELESYSGNSLIRLGDKTPFVTILARSQDLIERIKGFMKARRGSPFLIRSLDDRIQELERVEAQSRYVAKEFVAHAENSKGREAVLATAIALCLSPELQEADRRRAWLTQEIQNLRSEVRQLTRQFKSASAVSKERLKVQLLEIALPGDPLLEDVWSDRTTPLQKSL